MGRGQTTAEFAATHGRYWMYDGGLPGDPGWVSDAARRFGNLHGLDAEALDEAAEDHGWEFHDPGYDDKIQALAEATRPASEVEGERK